MMINPSDASTRVSTTGIGVKEDVCSLYVIVFVDNVDGQSVEEFKVIQKKSNLVASQPLKGWDLGAQ